MRLQILSDFHSEHFKDRGKRFIKLLNPENIDVLILAGDIAVGQEIPYVLKLFCDRFENSKVLYVNGNHEYYGTDFSSTTKYCKQAVAQNKNLTWLNNDIVEIQNKRFLGTPLWYKWSDEVHKQYQTWSDFRCVYDFGNWVFKENKKSIDFLTKEMKKDDIIITHYLPSWKCVQPQWVNAKDNCFFVCDIEDLILKHKPQLFVNGHTHCSYDFLLGKTRMVCNPYGYEGYEKNSQFIMDLVVEI